LAVGRQVPVKGFDVAIKAVAMANEENGTTLAELTVIGDGPERKALEALTKSLNAHSFVNFVGWLNNKDVLNLVTVSDALIIPSIFEPYGVIVLESMAQGRPVLASDAVIAALDRSQGPAILLHQRGDAVQLASHIQKLAADRDLLRRASESARATAELWRPERAAAILDSLLTKLGRASTLLNHAGERYASSHKRAAS
jgi:glycosyltransferase involved in cell wall biosynthesis